VVIETTPDVLRASDITYAGYYNFKAPRGSGPFCQGLTSRVVDGDFRLLFVGDVGSTPHQLFEVSMTGLAFGDTLTTITNKWDLPVDGNTIGDSQGIHWDAPTDRLWWWGVYDYTDDGVVRLHQIALTTDATDLAALYTGFGTTTLLRHHVALEGVHAKKVDKSVVRPPDWWKALYGVTQDFLIGNGGYHSKVSTGVSLGLALVALPDPMDYADNQTIPAADLNVLADHTFSDPDWYAEGHPTTFDRTRRVTHPTNYVDGGDYRQNSDTYPDGTDPNDPTINNGLQPTLPPAAGARWLSPAPDGCGRFVQGDLIPGAVWINTPSRSGLVTINSLKMGHVWYGLAHGHCESVAHELHIYDPATLGAAAQGTLAPCLVQPDSMTVLTLPDLGEGGEFPGIIDGMTYDPVAKRLYLIAYGINGVENAYMSRIYVYQVAA
jgi:hypothetical protein